MDSISSRPSLYWIEPKEQPYYPLQSVYRAEILINEHLRQNWNTTWTKIVSINQIILGLLLLTLGILMVFFQLTFAYSGHGIWTGTVIFIAGFFAFFTTIYRHHRYFLLVALIHLLAGLLSSVMIFLSALVLVFQWTDQSSSSYLKIAREDRQLTFALHLTFIILGLYEKVLCYTFLILLIRHTHQMV